MGIILFIILSLLVIIIIWKYHFVLTTCFFKHSFIKIILEIFALLLAILSIFYSIHADIFSDNTLSDNFLTYPINQLERNQPDYKQKIKYDNNIEKDSINFIFIIDRTLSGVNKKNDLLKKSLIDNAKNDILSKHKGIIEISDILLYKMMMELKSKNIDSSNCHIIIYNGIKQKPDERNENIERIEICIEPEKYLKKYINAIDNNNNNNTNTDISQLIKLESSDIKKNYNVVTIISDFEHEKDSTNIYKLGQEIDKFVTSFSDSVVLNIVCLNGNLRNNLSSIKETREIIEKYTRFINIYEYEQAHLTNETEKELSSFITQLPIKDSVPKIVFYYPLSFSKYSKTNTSKIQFSNIRGTEKFWINLKNESNPYESFFLEVIESGKKPVQLIDKPKLIEIDSSKTFTLVLASQVKPDNLFFEISKPSELSRQRITIEVKEYLTDITCFILVILNTLLIIMLVFFTWFFYFKCNKHCYLIKKRQGLKLGSKFIVILPVLSFYFFVLYSIKIALIFSLDFFIIWLIIILIFSLFLIQLFRFERNNFDKTCNELHKK
jgi:hypothetical protein